MLQKFEKYDTAHRNEKKFRFQKFILQVRHHSDRVRLVLRPPKFCPSTGFLSKALNGAIN